MELPKFEIFKDKAGYYRWRLKAGNGEIVANSEAYVSVANAKRSAIRVKEISGIAIII